MSLFNDPTTLSDTYLLQLFNLQRENVDSITIAHKSDAIYATIKLNVAEHACPVCNDKTITIKDYTTKKIVHSLVTNTACYILYKARRYQCSSCGKTFYERNPFVHKNMKISALTVSNVLRDLKKANETFTSVSQRYHISPTTAAAIFDAFVSMPRKQLPIYLNIDEVYAFKDNRSNYVCVFVDGLTKATVDLLPSRKQDDLLRYFNMIPLEERKRVQVVSIDLWATYKNVAKKVFPNARVSADKFHLIQELHRNIDKIRIDTMNSIKPKKKEKKLMSVQERYLFDKQDQQYYLLKKFHWLLFKDHDKLIEKNEAGQLVNKLDPNYPKRYHHKLKRYLNLYDIEQLLMEINKDIETAIDLKWMLTTFYRTCTYETAKPELEKLIIAFSDSELPELIGFANTMKRWKNEIIHSFIIIDQKTQSKANNGISENRNKVIKQLKHNSNGYKNWERFRARVMYVTNSDATFRLNPMSEKAK